MLTDFQVVLVEYCKTFGLKLGFWDRTNKKVRKPTKQNMAKIYATNVEIAKKYTAGGWGADYLVGLIRSAYEEKKEVTLLSEIFPKSAVNTDKNLLTGEEVHPSLFTKVEAPVFKELPDGSFEQLNVVSTPTRKKNFSIDDLLDYYTIKLGERVNSARDSAAFKWLLADMEDSALDTLLYAIDIAAEQKRDGDKVYLDNGPLSLKQFYADAIERLGRRRCLGKIY